jgi:hypothetical protein
MIDNLRVSISGDDLHADERADLARQLRGELLDIDVADVQPVASPTPSGAKSGAGASFGALLITLAPEILPQVIAVLTSWLRRQHPGVEVEIDGQRFNGTVTPEQRDEFVDAYLKRIGARETT